MPPQALEAWCAERPVEVICSALMEIGVPVAPVRTIPEVAKDPHVWEREMLVKMEDAVAGELDVPGVTVRCRIRRVVSVRCRRPASTPTKCWGACWAMAAIRSVSCAQAGVIA